MKKGAVVGLAVGLGAYALGIFYGYKYGIEVGKLKAAVEFTEELNKVTEQWKKDIDEEIREYGKIINPEEEDGQ